MISLILVINDLAGLNESVPGPIDQTNPVKHALYRLLMNANGEPVRVWVGNEEFYFDTMIPQRPLPGNTLLELPLP